MTSTTPDIAALGSGPIVMVDDDDFDRQVMERCVGRSNLENGFLPFSSGEDFLAYLERGCADGEGLPALVFMDVNMPTMNGFDVVAALRAIDGMGAIPVIVFLSDPAQAEGVARCAELGVHHRQKFSRPREGVEFLNSLAV